jgi:hypothetical protein
MKGAAFIELGERRRVPLAALAIAPRATASSASWSSVKGRKNGAGFTTLERWLADFDVLALRRNGGRRERKGVRREKPYRARANSAANSLAGSPRVLFTCLS